MASDVSGGPAEAPAAEGAGRGSAAPWLALGAALTAGGAWLLVRRGYEGGDAVWLGSAAFGLGVLALARGARRGWRATAAAAAVALLAGLVLGPLVSRRYHAAQEERAWQRFRAGGGDVKDRWIAYREAVPAPFQRPDPEVDVLLDDVRRHADVDHWLRQVLDELRLNHDDDPAFDPVRRAIAEELARRGG
jgi:hypothetical protein